MAPAAGCSATSTVEEGGRTNFVEARTLRRMLRMLSQHRQYGLSGDGDGL